MSHQVPDLKTVRARPKTIMVAASPFPYPQGSQVLIGQLAEALVRRGHRLRLVAYPSGVGQPGPGIRIHRTTTFPGIAPDHPGPSWQKPILDLFLMRTILRITRRWQAELIHVHNFEGLMAALVVRRLTQVPVVYHVHNAMGLELDTYFGNRLTQWAGSVVGRWVDECLPRRADYCILLNREATEYFGKRGVVRQRVVPPGIDFKPGRADRARQKLGHGPIAVYSGNLDRYQDLELLLQAFRLVADTHADARLVFCTNATFGKLQSRANALGLGKQTVFVQTDDFDVVRDLLAASDVTVCPRQVCLGFPIKILNYMAAGRAIVAMEGSSSGLRHMENGWVVRNGDVPGMAAAITALLENPALSRKLGQSAQQTARNEYTWDRAIDTIEEIYSQIPCPARQGRLKTGHG